MYTTLLTSSGMSTHVGYAFTHNIYMYALKYGVASIYYVVSLFMCVDFS